MIEEHNASLCACKALIKRAHLAPSSEELLKRSQDDLSRAIEDSRKKALEIIERETSNEEAYLQRTLVKSQQELDRCMNGLSPLDNSTLKQINDFKTKFDRIETRLNAVMKEMTEVRATMAAKVVKDKLQPDQFLRKTQDRFKLFETEGSITPALSVRPEDVQEAEKNVINVIEERIEQYCPIRAKPSALK